jgi:hypothetical protein
MSRDGQEIWTMLKGWRGENKGVVVSYITQLRISATNS